MAIHHAVREMRNGKGRHCAPEPKRADRRSRFMKNGFQIGYRVMVLKMVIVVYMDINIEFDELLMCPHLAICLRDTGLPELAAFWACSQAHFLAPALDLRNQQRRV